MITAYGTIERAVQAMKQGAFDFITKPFDLDHITLVVEKALERERLKRGLERFSEETGERYRLIGGESPKMRAADRNSQKSGGKPIDGTAARRERHGKRGLCPRDSSMERKKRRAIYRD